MYTYNMIFNQSTFNLPHISTKCCIFSFYTLLRYVHVCMNLPSSTSWIYESPSPVRTEIFQISKYRILNQPFDFVVAHLIVILLYKMFHQLVASREIMIVSVDERGLLLSITTSHESHFRFVLRASQTNICHRSVSSGRNYVCCSWCCRKWEACDGMTDGHHYSGWWRWWFYC